MVFVNRSSEIECLESGKYQLSFLNIRDKNVKHYHGVRGACMDEVTRNIFLTVSVSGMVYVYNINGSFLYQFGSKSPLTCLRNPWYNFVSHSLLYVSDYSVGKISIYSLEGDIITCFDGFGQFKYKFQRPNGMVIEQSTGDFYNCDTDHNRVMWIHDYGLGVKTFGERILSSPHEIKLCQETLFILSNGRIFNFSLNGIYLSKTELEADSIYGYYFVVGDNNEIIISDGGNHIYVSDKTGKLLATYKRNLENKHMPCIIKYKTMIVAIQNAES